jgi:hypothetical protein
MACTGGKRDVEDTRVYEVVGALLDLAMSLMSSEQDGGTYASDQSFALDALAVMGSSLVYSCEVLVWERGRRGRGRTDSQSLNGSAWVRMVRGGSDMVQ